MPRPLLQVQDTLDLSGQDQAAPLPEAADIVVIGGGIVGTAAAYYLARGGHSVALLEKGVIGGEQSSRNWGWCRQQNRDERELPLAKRSLELWETLAGEAGTDLGFRRTGLLYVTKSPEDMARWEAWVAMARGYQVHSRMLSAEEARAMTPGCDQPWIGGVHSPSDGRAEPGLAAPRLAEAARKAGATLHQHCAVRGLDLRGGAVAGVVTEKGRIRTSAVICAAGAWSSLFCRRHGVDLPQAGVRATAFRTTEAPELVSGGLATPGFVMRRRLDGGYTVAILGRGRLELTPQGLRYFRQFWPTFAARRQRLSIRVGRSFFQGPEAFGRAWPLDRASPFERTRVLDPVPDMTVVRDATAALKSAYPALADVQVADAWGGWIDSTPDALPVIAPVKAVPGLVLATGFSGHGFGVGPAGGRLAADLITGNTPLVDPEPFSHTRLIDGRDLGQPGMM